MSVRLHKIWHSLRFQRNISSQKVKVGAGGWGWRLEVLLLASAAWEFFCSRLHKGMGFDPKSGPPQNWTVPFGHKLQNLVVIFDE